MTTRPFFLALFCHPTSAFLVFLVFSLIAHHSSPLDFGPPPGFPSHNTLTHFSPKTSSPFSLFFLFCCCLVGRGCTTFASFRVSLVLVPSFEQKLASEFVRLSTLPFLRTEPRNGLSGLKRLPFRKSFSEWMRLFFGPWEKLV